MAFPRAADTSRRLILRVVVKMMFSALLIALIVVMIRPFLAHKSESSESLHVRVNQLDVGASQGVEWQKRRWLIIRPTAAKTYIVVLDYDSFYGCPLQWVKAGDTKAPLQPWPGGLRAICTDHWYDQQGHAISSNIADLKLFPYKLEGEGTLILAPP